MTTTTKQDVPVTAVLTEAEKSLPAVVGNTFEEMERVFDRLMPRGWLRPFRWDWPTVSELGERMDLRIPAVDVIDQDTNLLVRAEMPGISKEDIEVSATEHTLTMKSKARSESTEQNGEFFSCEISQNASARTIQLPSAIDPAQVTAKLQDGILEVTMAKANGSRRYKITVD